MIENKIEAYSRVGIVGICVKSGDIVVKEVGLGSRKGRQFLLHKCLNNLEE